MSSNEVSPIELFTGVYRLHQEYGHMCIPAAPGLYMLHSLKQVYFGMSRNLQRRVPQSQNEQGFGDTVYYLPARPRSSWKLEELYARVRKQEALCIQALHTITWGNSAPLFLANKKHARMLSDLAWSATPPCEIKFALDLAKTVLHDIGLHKTFSSLPSRQDLDAQRRNLIKAEYPVLLEKFNCRRQQTFKPANTHDRGHFSLLNAFESIGADERTSSRWRLATSY